MIISGRPVRDDLYSFLTGKVRKETDWNTLCNAALRRVDRRTFTSSLKGVPRLLPWQRKAVKRFFAPYVKHVSDRYHRIYTQQSGGRFFPHYIPEDLHFLYIDRYYCDREEARFLDNKCYYYWLMPDILHPQLVCMRLGRSWLDADLQLISAAQAQRLVSQERALVIKQAVNSECGDGVTFLESDGTEAKSSARWMARRFREVIRQCPSDVVVQRVVHQHPDLAALNPSSVNSMRIISFLDGDQVKVLGAIQKIGVGDARMDNSSAGGIICGVGEDGRLSDFGLYHDGRRCRTHPDLHYRFSDHKVPHLDRAFELVRRAHPVFAHFRLAGWDVTIDEDGRAVLIETNLSMGSINAFQVFHGPLFGEDTERILREVFGEKRPCRGCHNSEAKKRRSRSGKGRP